MHEDNKLTNKKKKKELDNYDTRIKTSNETHRRS
jgi:hypothetical protein